MCGHEKHFPGYADEWIAARTDAELHPVQMRYHKEEIADVGSENVYVRHCRSTRCAFVKTATVKGIDEELMYVYEPMGLDRQPDEMGTLLARFRNRNLAACFMEALFAKLRMKLMDIDTPRGTSCCMKRTRVLIWGCFSVVEGDWEVWREARSLC